MVMIPWVREKFTQRCAKWLALRGKNSRQPSLSLSLVNNNLDTSQTNREQHAAPEITTVLLSHPINVNHPCSELEQQQHREQQDQQQSEQQHQQRVYITSVANERELIVRVETLRTETTMVNACPVPIVASSNGNHLPHHQHMSSSHNNFFSTVSILQNDQYQNEESPEVTTTVRQLQSTGPDYPDSYHNSLRMEPRLLPKNSVMNDIRSRRSGASGSTRTSEDSSHISKHQSSSTNVFGEQKSHLATGSNNNGKERIKVRIISPSTRILSFQTENNKKLLELKNEVILELSDDMSSMPIFAPDSRVLGPRFRLIKADYEGHEMNEQQTLAQLNINHNDILVLVFKRNGLQQIVTQARETRPPVEADIESATRQILDRQNPLPLIDLNEIFQQSNLQFDVRKVLISLAQVSAVILGVGPYANRLIAMLKQKLINKRNYQNDTAQCLVDMGFTRERAEYALRIHNNVYSTALEWLIARQSDDLTDKKIPTIPKSNSISSPSGIISNDNVLENTAALLEIVRIFSHRDIPPNAETVQSLVEMGFDEENVILALKKTCNNKASACEWLCGNRTGSLVELRDGLTDESPILKTMIELPHVQLALGNPKTFLAFLTILENENTLRVWSSNETSSVITQILQKYHEEKHVLGINQFYHQR